jgi:hypothetical protein
VFSLRNVVVPASYNRQMARNFCRERASVPQAARKQLEQSVELDQVGVKGSHSAAKGLPAVPEGSPDSCTPIAIFGATKPFIPLPGSTSDLTAKHLFIYNCPTNRKSIHSHTM